MQKKQRVSVQSKESVISLGKSKRLAAMRKSVGLGINKGLSRNKPLSFENKEECEVQQAREVIRLTIASIKAAYRQGMQDKLFALRYGADEDIKQMSLGKLFTILNISQKLTRKLAEKKYSEG